MVGSGPCKRCVGVLRGLTGWRLCLAQHGRYRDTAEDDPPRQLLSTDVERPRGLKAGACVVFAPRPATGCSRLRQIHHPQTTEDAVLTLTGNGRLTRKPELRETPSGAKVTTVAIASSRRGSDDDPIYVDLVLWDAQAAFAAEHLVKGQAVTFTGGSSRASGPTATATPAPRSRFTPWRSSTAPSHAERPRPIPADGISA